MLFAGEAAGVTQYALTRHANAQDIVAVQGKRRISRADFEQDVAALARLLPNRRHILNLCTDRYRFMLGFAAALQRRQVSLLPSNIATATLADLAADYPDAYALVDRRLPGGERPPLECMDFPPLQAEGEPAALVGIPEDQPALVLFTSGSTGKPKPVPKNWGPLARSGMAAGTRLGGDALTGASIIGTVPHQHSYGLESMILLCWQQGLKLDAAWPLYPADIRAAIERAKRPRVLVTTPVHLRALLAEQAVMPAVDLILSATAPLPVEFAKQAEAAFGATLLEIYGCTEAGQVATRRSAAERGWHCLDGVQLHEDARGVFACGAAVQGEVLLHDRIELTGDAAFLLGERSADLVDVAGKRASLAQLTYLLIGIPGVQDGVFVMGQGNAAVNRLMAVVVAPGLDRKKLMQHLRQLIDPAFLPRPLIFTQALPRNALGKLPRDALLRLARAGQPE